MRFLGLSLMVALGGIACGDDSSSTDAGTDTGTADTSTPDTSVPDTAVPDTATDTPTGDTGDDAGPDRNECSPFAAVSECEATEKCSVVLDIDPEGAVTDVFFGCINGMARVGEGIPCGLNVDATPEDDTDDARGDNCDEGLFCTSFGNAPGDSFLRCKPVCDGETTDCGERGYCLGLNGEPFFGICKTPEDCDPIAQDCTGDRACYIFGSEAGDVVGDCWPFDPMEGEDGSPGSSCEFFDQCEPGTSCRGVSDTENECLSFCEVPPTPDGGVAPDAGMGTCMGADVCQTLEPPEGGEILIPTPAGICAPPDPDA